MASRTADGPVPWLTNRTLAWAGFDVMTSVYVGIVPNVFFPIYFQRYVAGESNATAAWGLLATVSIIIAGMAALGAAALARHVSRFQLLIASISGLVLSLLLLSLDLSLSIWVCSAAYVAAQSFYFATTTNYESYLPEIALPGAIGRVSGLAWSLGYLGGVAGTIILLATLGGRLEDPRLFQMTFAVVAMLTALLAVPAFVAMRRTGFTRFGAPAARPESTGILSIVRQWRNHKPIFSLLFGTMLVHAAIVVVVTFTVPILSVHFGQTYNDLLWLLLFLQLLSMPTTYISAMLSDNWSKYKAIMLVLSGWGVVLLLLAFANGAFMPWMIVAVLACCLGATNAAMRGFLAEAVLPNQSAAFFGISTFAGRMSSALGPLVFVLFAELAGERNALLAILTVLIAGAFILLGYLRRGMGSSTEGGAARLKAT